MEMNAWTKKLGFVEGTDEKLRWACEYTRDVLGIMNVMFFVVSMPPNLSYPALLSETSPKPNSPQLPVIHHHSPMSNTTSRTQLPHAQSESHYDGTKVILKNVGLWKMTMWKKNACIEREVGYSDWRSRRTEMA